MRTPALALLCLLAPTALAFRPDHGKRDFDALDADNNGQLSVDEVDADVKARFQAEIEAFMVFFDVDGDAKVTKAEYDGRAGEFFTTDARTTDWFWLSLFAGDAESATGCTRGLVFKAPPLHAAARRCAPRPGAPPPPPPRERSHSPACTGPSSSRTSRPRSRSS